MGIGKLEEKEKEKEEGGGGNKKEKEKEKRKEKEKGKGGGERVEVPALDLARSSSIESIASHSDSHSSQC